MSATTLFGTLTGYREGRCNNEEFPSATLGKRPCNNKDFLLAKNNLVRPEMLIHGIVIHKLVIEQSEVIDQLINGIFLFLLTSSKF